MKRNILISVLIIFTICSEAAYSSVYASVPILVLTADNNFGEYSGEILKTEGFNEFQTLLITNSDVKLNYLKEFDIIILTTTPLTDHLGKILSFYVRNGGNLIAFRPDRKICDLFGITEANGTISNGYIGVDGNNEIGKGITIQTLQLHVVADKYRLNGAIKIANLYNDADTRSGMPAVALNNYGKGHAIAFSYNLPENIIYTRQGNPEFAGQEKDGITGLRGMDLFTDGWINKSKNTLNQADEQMRLLTHCIEYLCTYTKPLPRFWYFPDTLKCLVTLTNDGESSSETDFEHQLREVDSLGARMSVFILDARKVSKKWVDTWTARGFEISGHPDDTGEAGDPKWDKMNKTLKAKIREIADLFGLMMNTVVNHWFVWCGRDSAGYPEFAAQAELEARNGIEMDVNYAHYDNKSDQGHFLGALGTDQGNFNGSGLVMKFATSKGKILNTYQHLNNVYDQQYTENNDAKGFFDCFRGLMDRSLEKEVYSFISVKAHNDEYYFSRKPLMQMLEYAGNNHVPVWTAEDLLHFMKSKDEAAFTDINWLNQHLSFKIHSTLKNTNGLTFLLPEKYGKTKIDRITLNGQNGQIIRRTVKDYEYAFVTVVPGNDYDISADYR